MFISFTLKDFLDMVATYNSAFWPMQLVAYALAIAALICAARGTNCSSRIVSAVLAFFWLWVGIVFNWMYFSKLSPAALAFAVLFVVEGIILGVAGVLRKDLSFRIKAGVYGLVAAFIVLYGMVGYPAIEYLLGRGYPRLLVLGLVPCPTTVFTLGMFFWTEKRLPKYVLIIPFLYSLSGVIPLILGIVEDLGLGVAGFVTAIMLLYRDRSRKRE